MTNNIALKTYLDEVKNICDELSRGKLSDFIIEMAKSISSKERNKFLQKLKKHSVDESEIPTDNQRMILNRINELREDIIERQKSIDDGSFYEDYYYDEEEADPISEEQKNELEHLFYDAEKLFLANKLDNARDIYEALISLFYMSDKEEEWLDLDLKEVDIKWKETLANYCRCVYETSLPENKIENMIKALKIHLPQFDRDFNLEEEVYPLLQDVYDAKVAVPENWTDFLNELKPALRGKTNNRAFVLLLEIIDKTDGLSEVETEVKQYKISAGYLYLLDKLVKNQEWDKISNTAQEAINNISDKLRLGAAEILIFTAEKLEDQQLLLKGKREVFFSESNNKTLQLLLEEAKKQGLKKEELEKVIKFLNKKSRLVSIKIEAMLMLGQIDNALEIVKKGPKLGWSSRRDLGLSFSGILIALSNADIKTNTQSNLLKNYIESEFSYSKYVETYDEQNFICQELYEGLKNVKLGDSKEKELFLTLETLGKSRIDEIVSNKHRRAYKRAAEVLGALAEYYLIKNDKQKATSLITEFRNQKYKRYPAFRSEIDSVAKDSALLKALSIK